MATLSIGTMKASALPPGTAPAPGRIGIVRNGTEGNDTLQGIDGFDTLRGFGGNDTLRSGRLDDLLDGGLGVDLADYGLALSGVRVDLAIAGPQATLGAGSDTLVSIEGLVGSNFGDLLFGDAGANQLQGGLGSDYLEGRAGDDLIVGGEGDDTLAGGLGNDTLGGGNGNDTLSGGAGDDVLDGGFGADRVLYTDATAGVYVNLAATGLVNTRGAGFDRYVSIEHASGSGFDDSLVGNADGNDLRGQAGNDQLLGQAGNDVLDGGAGDDRLNGGLGDDVLRGGAGFDTADYGSVGRSISVDLTATVAQNTGGAGFDLLSGIEAIIGSTQNDVLLGDMQANLLQGGLGNDVLVGRDGNDVLEGSHGNDRLEGGAGDDVLHAGLGTDTLNGGEGIDWADYSTLLAPSPPAGSGVLADLGASGLFVDQTLKTDRIVDVENLRGSAGQDKLIGDARTNHIDGGAGNDTFYVGGGGDVLTGGSGQDEFEFTSASIGHRTTITDFDAAKGDILILYMIGVDYFDFIGDAEFVPGRREAVRFADGIVEVDNTGDGFADLTIALSGVSILSADSFALSP